MPLRRVVIRQRRLHLVPQNELIVDEKPLLNGQRSTDAGVGGWKEPNKR